MHMNDNSWGICFFCREEDNLRYISMYFSAVDDYREVGVCAACQVLLAGQRVFLDAQQIEELRRT